MSTYMRNQVFYVLSDQRRIIFDSIVCKRFRVSKLNDLFSSQPVTERGLFFSIQASEQ